MSSFYVVKNCLWSFFIIACASVLHAVPEIRQHSFFDQQRYLHQEYQFCLQVLSSVPHIRTQLQDAMVWAFTQEKPLPSDIIRLKAVHASILNEPALPTVYKEITVNFVVTVYTSSRKKWLIPLIAAVILAGGAAAVWKWRNSSPIDPINPIEDQINQRQKKLADITQRFSTLKQGALSLAEKQAQTDALLKELTALQQGPLSSAQREEILMLEQTLASFITQQPVNQKPREVVPPVSPALLQRQTEYYESVQARLKELKTTRPSSILVDSAEVKSVWKKTGLEPIFKSFEQANMYALEYNSSIVYVGLLKGKMFTSAGLAAGGSEGSSFPYVDVFVCDQDGRQLPGIKSILDEASYIGNVSLVSTPRLPSLQSRPKPPTAINLVVTPPPTEEELKMRRADLIIQDWRRLSGLDSGLSKEITELLELSIFSPEQRNDLVRVRGYVTNETRLARSAQRKPDGRDGKGVEESKNPDD